MEPKFNIDRPKISDEEINQHKNFDQLVKQFKEKSLKQAQGDESWWKNKTIRYSTVIAGVTVICTISYFTIFKNSQKQEIKHETLNTQSTQTNNTKSQFVAPPSQKLKTPYTAYKVNNAKGGEFVHKNSSKIRIPVNSFVDKKGKDIIGDVTIEYREFHDMGDIIGSGIPMAYDSAGKKFNLESAGMFDIRGTHDGEPVFIKPDKNLQVELASMNNEDRFNQYYLDTVARNWQYLKKDKPLAAAHEKKPFAEKSNTAPSPSARQLSLKKDIEMIIPKKIDSVKTYYNTRVFQLPKAKEPVKPAEATKGRPVFTLDGNNLEFPELAAFNNVVFEVGPENSNYSKEMHEITWSDVKISQGPVKGKNYILNLSYRNRQEKLIVYPVLKGKDYDKALEVYQAKFSEYERLAENRNESERRLLAEMQAKQQAYLAEMKRKQQEYADLERARTAIREQNEMSELQAAGGAMSNTTKAMRLFNISRFGIFNSDCAHLYPNGSEVTPVFVRDNGQNFVSPDFLYLVDHSTKSVFSYQASGRLAFTYAPGRQYSICVFAGGKIYLCDKVSFNRAVEAAEKKFPVMLLAEGSDNLVDLKKALEI